MMPGPGSSVDARAMRMWILLHWVEPVMGLVKVEEDASGMGEARRVGRRVRKSDVMKRNIIAAAGASKERIQCPVLNEGR